MPREASAIMPVFICRKLSWNYTPAGINAYQLGIMKGKHDIMSNIKKISGVIWARLRF
jgi:hypothetical protein